MYRCVLLVFLVLPSIGQAQLPVPGELCQGVNPPTEEDFWNKWNTADYVVYGLSLVGLDGGGPAAYERPDPAEVTFTFIPTEVWKGPETLPALEVSTSWDYYVFYCGGPAGMCHYMAEACSLEVPLAQLTVLFLRFDGSVLSSYMSFGSGVYDYQWLVDQVDTPVSTESATWGGVKSIYR